MGWIHGDDEAKDASYHMTQCVACKATYRQIPYDAGRCPACQEKAEIAHAAFLREQREKALAKGIESGEFVSLHYKNGWVLTTDPVVKESGRYFAYSEGKGSYEVCPNTPEGKRAYEKAMRSAY